MEITPILTPRLKIRSQTKDDLAFALGIWGDPVMGQYLTDPCIYNMSGQYFEELKTIHESTDCCYLIAESRENGLRIGTCSFILDEETHTCDLGYTIHQYFWRQGYGSEMVQAVIDFAKTLGATRFTAPVSKANPGSNALIRKLGFVPVGEQAYKKAGTDNLVEEYCYELTV